MSGSPSERSRAERRKRHSLPSFSSGSLPSNWCSSSLTEKPSQPHPGWLPDSAGRGAWWSWGRHARPFQPRRRFEGILFVTRAYNRNCLSLTRDTDERRCRLGQFVGDLVTRRRKHARLGDRSLSWGGIGSPTRVSRIPGSGITTVPR